MCVYERAEEAAGKKTKHFKPIDTKTAGKT